MMTGLDTIAAIAVGGFMLLGFALMLFMALVQPIWCLVDCAVDPHRSGAGKGVWIVVLILLYGLANWFYGALAAHGTWLRRLTRLAWLFGFLLMVAFIVLYNMSDGFRRGIDEQWHKQQLVVAVPALAR
jgi:hypothetical protein